MAERLLLVAGAALLVVGTALQAATEIREYWEFVDVLMSRSELGPAGSEIERVWMVESAVLTAETPRSLGNAVWELVRWLATYRVAMRSFTAQAASGDLRASSLRATIVRTRNWGIVLAGSLLVFVASLINLVD